MTCRNIHIQNVHIKFNFRSSNSLYFNWFVKLFAKKYGSLVKKFLRTKNCQNAFPVISRLKNGTIKLEGEGSKALMARPLNFFFGFPILYTN